MAHAVTAIDIALWDVTAKILGLPLYQLLGGELAPIRCYATVSSEDDVVDDEHAVLKKTFAAGYTAFKLRIGRQSLSQDLERLVMDTLVALF